MWKIQFLLRIRNAVGREKVREFYMQITFAAAAAVVGQVLLDY